MRTGGLPPRIRMGNLPSAKCKDVECEEGIPCSWSDHLSRRGGGCRGGAGVLRPGSLAHRSVQCVCWPRAAGM
jgi:hypothetical protein